MVVKNKKGQALIELIIFLPLMFSLYGIISGFANAINGSINQQKIARAYFYFRIQNSSMIPRIHPVDPETGESTGQDSWTKFGMFFIGWADYLEGGRDPIMPCYEITIPFVQSGNDSCELPYSTPSTQFIRVGTVYGICGATFAKDQYQQYYLVPDSIDQYSSYEYLTSIDSCLIQ